MLTENERETVTIRRHADGVALGEIVVARAAWESYHAGEDQAYQWPEGIARAGDVLPAREVARLGIDPATVIYHD